MCSGSSGACESLVRQCRTSDKVECLIGPTDIVLCHALPTQGDRRVPAEAQDVRGLEALLYTTESLSTVLLCIDRHALESVIDLAESPIGIAPESAPAPRSPGDQSHPTMGADTVSPVSSMGVHRIP